MQNYMQGCPECAHYKNLYETICKLYWEARDDVLYIPSHEETKTHSRHTTQKTLIKTPYRTLEISGCAKLRPENIKSLPHTFALPKRVYEIAAEVVDLPKEQLATKKKRQKKKKVKKSESIITIENAGAKQDGYNLQTVQVSSHSAYQVCSALEEADIPPNPIAKNYIELMSITKEVGLKLDSLSGTNYCNISEKVAQMFQLQKKMNEFALEDIFIREKGICVRENDIYVRENDICVRESYLSIRALNMHNIIEEEVTREENKCKDRLVLYENVISNLLQPYGALVERCAIENTCKAILLTHKSQEVFLTCFSEKDGINFPGNVLLHLLRKCKLNLLEKDKEDIGNLYLRYRYLNDMILSLIHI